MFIFFRDYRAIPGLDRYDPANLDDSEVDDLSVGDRLEAEAEMRRRDREEGRSTGRLRKGLLYGKLLK